MSRRTRDSGERDSREPNARATPLLEAISEGRTTEATRLQTGEGCEWRGVAEGQTEFGLFCSKQRLTLRVVESGDCGRDARFRDGCECEGYDESRVFVEGEIVTTRPEYDRLSKLLGVFDLEKQTLRLVETATGGVYVGSFCGLNGSFQEAALMLTYTRAGPSGGPRGGDAGVAYMTLHPVSVH